MRFSNRDRLRPTSCAFSGLPQKPETDISRSISSSALRAASRSKIAPDRAEPVAKIVDAGERVFSHGRRTIVMITTKHATHANQSPNLTYGVMVLRGWNFAKIV